ncbi:Uncharacterised protein [uncultured archaeon]|nr:Uncharacterised protein [uncultured archaeon]
MEYLMTYSWAILVVMLVGIVMWQLGIFNMGSTTMTFKGFTRIKPQLAGTAMREDGTFTGVFFNGAGTDIAITAVEINSTLPAGSCQGRVTLLGNVVTPQNVVKAGSGDNFVVYASGCAAGKRGEVYSIDITMEYNLSIGNVMTVHKEFGTIRGPYETA